MEIEAIVELALISLGINVGSTLLAIVIGSVSERIFFPPATKFIWRNTNEEAI